MPGLGSQSQLGMIVETTAYTVRNPTQALPFTSESFSASQEEIPSDSIGGTGMRQEGTEGDPEASGSIRAEFDAETSGKFLYAVTGPEGYTANGAFTTGQITTAPGATAGSTGASIAAGDYYYRVAAVWTHDVLGVNFIMPQSSPSTQTTVASGEEVALTWTDPTGLTLAGHTYKGTHIYRSETDGANTTCTFIAHVSGTGASYTDTGADTYADTNVSPVPNTAMYSHEFAGAAAADGEDRLETYTIRTSKNVGSDERFWGNKLNVFTLTVSERGAKVVIDSAFLGSDGDTVSSEQGLTAPTLRKPITGKKARVVVNGTLDCDIKSITVVINNNCERDTTLCAATIAEGIRDVGGAITLKFVDRVLYNLAQLGEACSLEIWIYGEPLATGCTTTANSHNVAAIPYPRLCHIDCQSVKLNAFQNPVSGQGQIEGSTNWSAFEDAVTSTDCTIKLWNTISEYTGV